MINRLDFIGVPSQDADRARRFYRDTLGLRPDEHGDYEQWAGDTHASDERQTAQQRNHGISEKNERRHDRHEDEVLDHVGAEQHVGEGVER